MSQGFCILLGLTVGLAAAQSPTPPPKGLKGVAQLIDCGGWSALWTEVKTNSSGISSIAR